MIGLFQILFVSLVINYYTAEALTLRRPNHADPKATVETIHGYKADFTTRRDSLTSVAAACSFLVATVVTVPAHATSPQDAGEAVRRAAANIPGYGPTDVFYPPFLVGNWKMNREVDFGNGRDPLRLSYTIRFIPSIQEDAVVADRGFNQAQLEQAILQTVRGADEGTSSVRRSSYEWVPTNPNDLRVVLADGTRKEIKVTKRATERTDTTVSSSEFQRITQEVPGGIPDISARRVVTKWKVVDDNTLEGLEIMYKVGGGDPMAASSSTNANPTVLSKSRMILAR
jgi:hypothetical protein